MLTNTFAKGWKIDLKSLTNAAGWNMENTIPKYKFNQKKQNLRKQIQKVYYPSIVGGK